jgi:putative hemolysin
MEIILFIVLVLVVIVLSGLISGTEAALLSTSYPEIKDCLTNSKEKKEKKKAENLLDIKENLQRYITTIVILNNIVNIVGSMFIGLIAAKLFNNSLIVGLISGGLTFLIILFSEIIPKVVGEKHSLEISLKISGTLKTITKMLHFIVVILNKLTNLFVDTSRIEKQVSEGVIREMALMGKMEGSINKYESELINNVFSMDDTEIYDVMVPKNKVNYVTKRTNFQEIINLISETGHTRFPVLSNDGENDVLGLINVKDLFKFNGRELSFKVEKIVRPIEFAPETMKLSTLEKKLRHKRTHMAAVFNEHGELSGILTLEDIFEELVGEIEDEYDHDIKSVKKVRNDLYIAEGSCEISDLNQFAGLDLDTEKDYSTLNGLIVAKLGIIPRVSHAPIKFRGCEMRVLKSNKKQILSIQARKFSDKEIREKEEEEDD